MESLQLSDEDLKDMLKDAGVYCNVMSRYVLSVSLSCLSLCLSACLCTVCLSVCLVLSACDTLSIMHYLKMLENNDWKCREPALNIHFAIKLMSVIDERKHQHIRS